MNILLTLNDNYVRPCTVMLHSIIKSNPSSQIHFYIIYQNLTWENQDILAHSVSGYQMTFLPFPESYLKDCPTSKRYPVEMYFRLFAAELLPDNLDRILYLDPDMVIINPLDQLYHIDFENHIFVATTHVQKFFSKLNEHRLSLEEDTPYINTGVLLMNLKKLRQEHNQNNIHSFIKENKMRLLLPDQDVFTALYGNQTKLVDASIYNLGEKYLLTHHMTGVLTDKSLDWVRNNAVIIHYYGKNKPWKKDYVGNLDIFYHEMEQDML